MPSSVWRAKHPQPPLAPELQPVRAICLSRDVDKMVVQASEQEIARFGSGAPLSMRKAPVITSPGLAPAFARIQPGERLYNAAGELVAWVEGMNISRDLIDITSMNDSFQKFAEGGWNCRIEARGIIE